MTSDDASQTLSAHYRSTRTRIVGLLASSDAEQLSRDVPACPGWRVRDVVAHLVGVVEDALAGRLHGPPPKEQTAAQVARWSSQPFDEVLAQWEDLSPTFEAALDASGIWPAVIDAATHEHDLRAAIGRPGARDSETVRLCADMLIDGLDPPTPFTVVMEERQVMVGTGAQRDLVLETDRFETFRWRLGRRSRAQLRGLRWTGDPDPVIDHLCIFGPSPVDLIE